MQNVIIGEIIKGEKKYPFKFENEFIEIECAEAIKIFDFDVNDYFSEDVLYGEIYHSTSFVYFNLDKNIVQCRYKSNVLSIFMISIKCISYYITDYPILYNNITLTLKTNKFSKWLNLYLRHDLKLDDENAIWYDNSFLPLESTKLYSTFEYMGRSIKVYPSVSCHYSANSSEFTSELCFDILGECGIIFLTKFLEDVRKLLCLVFNRQNVELGNINIFKENFSKTSPFKKEIGELVVTNLKKVKMEEPNLGNLQVRGFIPWKIMHKYFGSIINQIENNDMYIYDFPEHKNDRNVVTINTIQKDSSAFEYEFSKLYPDYKSIKISNTDYIQVEKHLNDMIDSTEESIKSIYVQFRSRLYAPSLREKILYAFNNFDEKLNSYFKKILKDINYQQIATEFVKIRNAADHGSLKLKIDNKTAQIFYCIKILIFAMRLQYFSFEVSDIELSINEVFEF